MSKQLLDTLADTLLSKSGNKPSKGITMAHITEVGEKFREESEYAIHRLDISVRKLKLTIDSLLAKLGVTEEESPDDSNELRAVRKEINKINNVSLEMARYLNERFLYAANNNSFNIPLYVESNNKIIFGTKLGDVSNFESITKFFVSAADLSSDSSQNSAIKQMIKEFFYTYNTEDPSFGESLGTVLESGGNLIDKGHSTLSSNIAQAIGALIINGIQTHPTSVNLFDDTPEAKKLRRSYTKELRLIEQGMLQALLNDSNARSLFNKSYGGTLGVEGDVKPEDAAFIRAIIAVSIGFVRRVVAGKIKINIQEKDVLNDALIAEIARSIVVDIFPQESRENRSIGAAIEKRVATYFRGMGLGVLIKRYLDPNLMSASDRNTLGLPSIDNLEGSPSSNKIIADMIYQNLQFGKAKDVVYSSTGKSKPGNSAAIRAKINKKPKSVSKPISKVVPQIEMPVKVAKRLNIINIVNLINMKLAETIRQNMGSPRLNYRTGRFAKSATVLPGMMDKDGALRLPYTYMKYPYQTFEPGFARGSAARDPKVVIGESIKELAIRLVLMKMRVVRV